MSRARQLNRATLARQLLLDREPLPVVAAVERIGALQAQQAAAPYVALFNRIADFDPAELDRAFAEQAVIKTQLMRITLHAVTAADYPAFHTAMRPSLRASCLGDERFTSGGLSVQEADARIPELVAFAAQPRTHAEVRAFLGAEVWWALRRFSPLVHAPTGGPWSFAYSPSFVAGPEVEAAELEAAQVHLARRYLEGFGPASVADFAQFTRLARGPARAALAHFHELEDGLFDVPGASPLPDADTPAPPRLMAMWDSVLLAYADRSRVIPEDYRSRVIRRNGDVLPTLLVDGHVAGVWQATPDGIQVSAFHRLRREDWTGVEAEAARLSAFLADRDPGVFGRYGHWWDKLAAGEQVRTL